MRWSVNGTFTSDVRGKEVGGCTMKVWLQCYTGLEKREQAVRGVGLKRETADVVCEHPLGG